jgi:hypothetical protein
LEPSLAEQLAYQALLEQKSDFFKAFNSRSKIPSDDPYTNEITYNIQTLFNHLLYSICHPIEEEKIKRLAYKTAVERVKAESDFDDCIHNISVCREIILSMCNQVNLPRSHLVPIIIKINQCMDSFFGTLVSQYIYFKTINVEKLNDYVESIQKERANIIENIACDVTQRIVLPLEKMNTKVEQLHQTYQDDPVIVEILHEFQSVEPYSMNYALLSCCHEEKPFDSHFISLVSVVKKVLSYFQPQMEKEQIAVFFNPVIEGFFYGCESEIKQAVFCLIKNALDALQLKGNAPRKLEIEIRDDRTYVELDIKNNGPYIPGEYREVLFAPFFTTKSKSAGIGLYFSKKMIEKHNGKITFESNAKWTEFSVRLPSCTSFQVIK